MSDPVSWLLVEKGWEVVDAAGEKIGQVEEVVGDRDIFSGLAISTGLLHQHHLWVPADQVAEMTEDRVQLSISADGVDRLKKHEPPDV